MVIKKRDIEYTETLDFETRAEIVYRHLVLNESTRQIEREVLNIVGGDWESWKVLRRYKKVKKKTRYISTLSIYLVLTGLGHFLL